MLFKVVVEFVSTLITTVVGVEYADSIISRNSHSIVVGIVVVAEVGPAAEGTVA